MGADHEITIYTVILFVEFNQLHDGIHCIINTILWECRVIYFNNLIKPRTSAIICGRAFKGFCEDNDSKFACQVLAMLPRLMLSFSLRLVWLHWLWKQALLSCQCSILWPTRDPRYYINHAESVPTNFATLLTLIINTALLLQTKKQKKTTTLVYWSLPLQFLVSSRSAWALKEAFLLAEWVVGAWATRSTLTIFTVSIE